MTRNNYNQAAKQFRENCKYLSQKDQNLILDFLCHFFQRDNLMFDAQRFRTACKKEEL